MKSNCPVESRIEYVILRPLLLRTSVNAKTRSKPTHPSIAPGRLQVSPERTTCSTFGPTSLPITLKQLTEWKERFSMPATGLLSDQTWATSDVSSLTNP